MATMTVTFVKTSNDPRQIPKTYSGAIAKSCEVIEPFSIESPTLKLNYDTSLIGYSIAKITLGSREYVYNVNPNFNVRNGIMFVGLSMSYIDTYTNEILNAQARITRSGSSSEKWLQDELCTQYANDQLICKKIGHGFTKGNTFIWVKGITYLDNTDD